MDSADSFRMQVAKNELDILLQDKGLVNREIPILFYANKNDLQSAASAVDVSTSLGLDNVTDRPWKI